LGNESCFHFIFKKSGKVAVFHSIIGKPSIDERLLFHDNQYPSHSKEIENSQESETLDIVKTYNTYIEKILELSAPRIMSTT